jgi:hypothetical protein
MSPIKRYVLDAIHNNVALEYCVLVFKPGVPLIVTPEAETVTCPDPICVKSILCPAFSAVDVLTVTVIAEEIVNVTNFPASELNIEYVVPVCGFITCAVSHCPAAPVGPVGPVGPGTKGLSSSHAGNDEL